MNQAIDIQIENIDVDKLRQDLINYYLGATYMVNPAAKEDIQRIKLATNEELVQIALKEKINLIEYLKPNFKTK